MSPVDGSIAFASPRSGHGDIYLWRPGAASPERLTDHPAFEAWPAFTRDGKCVAFSRDERGYSHIFLLELATKRETQLTSDAVVDEIDSFSPDGKSAIVRRGHYTGGLGLQSERVVVNLDHLDHPSPPMPVGTSACFSPDNQKIFFSDLDEKSHRDVVGSVDRRGEHRAAVCDGYLCGVLPDGRTFVLMLDRETDWVLYQPATRVRKSLPFGNYASWAISSDGAKIVFTRHWGQHLLQYDVAAGRVDPLDGPPGWVRAISPCKDGFLIVARGQGERIGSVYFLDIRIGKTKKLFAVEE